jgi:hypothetical protein
MKNTRDIVVKAFLNADEFLSFESACESADVKHSPKVRELINEWTARQHDRRRAREIKRPAAGHNRAMLLPGRVRTGGHLMSMRM